MCEIVLGYGCRKIYGAKYVVIVKIVKLFVVPVRNLQYFFL